MKLDAWPFNTATPRVDPHAALVEIRRAIRPAVMRSQRRWKRKARMRRFALRAEMAAYVVIGVSGTVLAALFVASEARHFVALLVELAR